MTKHTSVYAALIAAQNEFGEVQKKAEAQMGNRKFSYATLDDIYNATMPALTRHGIWLEMYPLEGEGTVGVEAVLHHPDSGTQTPAYQWVTPPASNEIRALGSALTYARRYLLQTILNIAAEEDSTDGGKVISKPGQAGKALRQAVQQAPPIDPNGKDAQAPSEADRKLFHMTGNLVYDHWPTDRGPLVKWIMTESVAQHHGFNKLPNPENPESSSNLSAWQMTFGVLKMVERMVKSIDYPAGELTAICKTVSKGRAGTLADLHMQELYAVAKIIYEEVLDTTELPEPKEEDIPF